MSSDYVVADRLRPCWLFLLSTGLRRREVCALRWQDIDLAAKRLTVRQAVKIDGERTGRFLRFENANGGSEHLDWHEGERSGERMRLRWYEAISGVSSMGDLYTYVPKSKNMNSDVKQVGDSL